MADVKTVKINVDTSGAVAPLNDLSQATEQVAENVNATNEALDKSASLSQTMGGALKGAAAGFQLVQGAMGAFGAESKHVEQALLKVQSAMAISEGIKGFKEAIPSIKAFGTALKGAIGASGIGLLVVALGAIVAYWDDIKSAVSGVSAEQQKLNAETEANVVAQQKVYDTLNSQDNVLKLQGKSEREILQIKANQIKAVIKATEAQLVQQEATKKAQISAARRNNEILQGILKFLTAPIQALLKTVDMVGSALGKDFGLQKGFNKSVANIFFDPDEVKVEGDKTIEETKNKLAALKNESAGFELSLKQKPASSTVSTAGAKVVEEAKKEIEELEYIKRESGLKAISNLVNQRNAELEITKETLAEEKRLRDEAAQKELERQTKLEEDKKKLVYDSLNFISEITTLFGQKNERVAKAMFNIDKAAKLASATMSAREAVLNAFKTASDSPLTTVFPAYPFIQAGLAGAFGAVNIAKIASQKFQASGGASDLASGGGGGAGGVSSAAPSFNVVGNSGLNQLAQIQQTPVQAYVVSGEVTSAQALDRNRIKNATL